MAVWRRQSTSKTGPTMSRSALPPVPVEARPLESSWTSRKNDAIPQGMNKTNKKKKPPLSKFDALRLNNSDVELMCRRLRVTHRLTNKSHSVGQRVVLLACQPHRATSRLELCSDFVAPLFDEGETGSGVNFRAAPRRRKVSLRALTGVRTLLIV